MSEQSTPKDTKETAKAQVAGLEKWGYETFNTKNPVQIPENGRKWIAENVWWLAAVGGVLTLIGAYQMWQAAHYVSQFDSFYRAIGYTGVASVSMQWYILFAITVLAGIVMLVAVQKLKAMQKSGWNLLFYLSLLGVAMGIIGVLTPSYGFGYLLGVALGVAISWTILMQIRDKFSK